MIEKATSAANIASMLATLKNTQAQAQQGTAINGQQPSIGLNQVQQTDKPSFMDAVRGAVENVNQTQQASRSLQNAFERGEDVPLTDVVLGMQKSSLAFEATLQVRNKVLKAYEDILNMPV
ncbi:Flagellar hook-basal body complex protein FliE [Betaproteobacteria bacterium MOLA814]|jgi:flagellar hook-basal body complex protein FliE|nr:Flagellar hook-basal body complex protein FliE [Betaproteobacteria bacterium MOLA814]|tara:strand:- start:146 stop:508 length:363 start_codon:yes stop_codon:yes gene_type:complete